jgi:hypothetical protein
MQRKDVMKIFKESEIEHGRARLMSDIATHLSEANAA